MWFEYVTVFVIAALAGAWSLFFGVLFGLDPIGVYVAGVAGSLVWTTFVLVAGGRVTDWILRRFPSDRMERIKTGRPKRIMSTWGEPGLAIIGGAILGPTVTLVAALVLRVDRRRFAIWFYASIFVTFALFTWFWNALLN